VLIWIGTPAGCGSRTGNRPVEATFDSANGLMPRGVGTIEAQPEAVDTMLL
jgi:hypothetical protein